MNTINIEVPLHEALHKRNRYVIDEAAKHELGSSVPGEALVFISGNVRTMGLDVCICWGDERIDPPPNNDQSGVSFERFSQLSQFQDH